MAKGFFDIVDQYNKSGYGAFQNRGYSPEELAQMYHGQNRGYLPTMHERAGFGLGAALANLGGAIYKATSPKQKAAREAEARKQGVSDIALEDIKSRAQQIAQERGVDPRAAMEAAAVEAFGQQTPKASRYNNIARETALRTYQEAQNLKEGAGKMPAPTKKVQFVNPATNERGWFDLKNETPPPGWEQLDESVQTQGVTDPSDPEYEFQLERDRFSGDWKLSTDDQGNPIRRKVRGGTTVNFSDDAFGLRTEAQAGQAYETGLKHIEAYTNANLILNEVVNLAKELPWAANNTVGGLSVAAEKLKGVGEFINGTLGAGTTDEAFYEIRNAEGQVTGRQTYSELTNPGKYMSAFEKMANAGALTQRIKASLIELAYMIAVAEEPSARGISDNDIERRLLTLGDQAGTKDTFLQILSDAQRRLALKFGTRLNLDPIYRAKGEDGRSLRDIGLEQLGMYDPGPMTVPDLDATSGSAPRRNQGFGPPIGYTE